MKWVAVNWDAECYRCHRTVTSGEAMVEFRFGPVVRLRCAPCDTEVARLTADTERGRRANIRMIPEGTSDTDAAKITAAEFHSSSFTATGAIQVPNHLKEK